MMKRDKINSRTKRERDEWRRELRGVLMEYRLKMNQDETLAKMNDFSKVDYEGPIPMPAYMNFKGGL